MKKIFKSTSVFLFSIIFSFESVAMQICVSTPSVCHTEMVGWTFLENHTVKLMRDVCVPGVRSCMSIPDPISMIRPNDLIQQNILKNFNWSQYNDFQKQFSQSFTQNYQAKLDEIKKSIQSQKQFSLQQLTLSFDSQYSTKDVEAKTIKEVINLKDTVRLLKKDNPYENWDDIEALINLRNTRIEIFGKEKDFFQPYVDSQNEITQQLLKQSNQIIEESNLPLEFTVNQTPENNKNGQPDLSETFENDLAQSSADSISAMEEVGLIKKRSESKIFATTNPANLAKVKYAYQRLDKAQPKTSSQGVAKDLGLKAVNAADVSFSKNEQAEGDHYYQLATMLGDVALGLIPIVGPTKDLIEAISGKSILSGESLPTSARWIAGVGALSFGLFGYFRAGIKLVKTAEALEHTLPSSIRNSLANIVTESAVEVNKNLAKYGYHLPPYPPNTFVTKAVTQTEIKGQFVRYAINKDYVARRFIVEKRLVDGLSPHDIKDVLQLPEIPIYISEVSIPAGVTLRYGSVNKIYNQTSRTVRTQWEIAEELITDRSVFMKMFSEARKLK